MGFYERFKATQTFLQGNSSEPVITGILSPWADSSHIAKVVWSDHFQGGEEVVTRESALQLPGVVRSLGLLKSAIADLPLVAYRGDERLSAQPTFLQRTPKGTPSPWHRMANTLDDLFFYGVSIWAVERGAAGQILNAMRVPYDRWSERNGELLVDDKPVPADEVVIIPGPMPGGFLSVAAETIRGARAMDKAWVGRVQNPFPLTTITQTTDEPLEADEIAALIETWSAARNSPNGAVGFIPYGLELTPHFGNDDSALFIEGDNKVRLNVANYANIPASLLDGSTATASLTYTTAEGQKSSFYEQSVRYWLAPIEHSLSGDDVVPQGQRIRADISFQTQVAPTGEPTDD